MATCAVNKKLQLAAVLYLALVVAAAATRHEAEMIKQECTVPEKVEACVQQIQDDLTKPREMETLLKPSCCVELREQLGCACALRDAVLKAGLDIGAPFCTKASGCQ
ncbi:hypothetical protein BAE44_0020031 [Dichanthelium oligosanthes]|uniref:Bifunctional inhibitor/plant lipid transfer protein/seed storage helical domain-containing protein n=1 Tax=Dichanthelium oligosanthes TaxID=888268 RepID=A0A1E5V1C0_9POAL|nr:hypothetical protein BAE44_0020031 [Dichanthelium oligosanthes]